MTQHVIECQAWNVPPSERNGWSRRAAIGWTTHGFKPALLTGLLAFVAALSFAPSRNVSGALATLLGVLALDWLTRGQAPWGWLAIAIGIAVVLLPRPTTDALGASLFVAWWMCLSL